MVRWKQDEKTQICWANFSPEIEKVVFYMWMERLVEKSDEEHISSTTKR